MSIPGTLLYGKYKVLLLIFIILLVANGVVGSLLILSYNAPGKKNTVSKVSSKAPSAAATLEPNKQKILLSKKEGEFIVDLKENPSDKTKSDIYVKDKKSGKEEFFITLKDVYIDHYHNAEYHNGNIYILMRPGGAYSYKNNPQWTDELWRYNQQKKGEKLFAAQGLDFRVSDDEQVIAVMTGKKFALLDKTGDLLSNFPMSDLVTNEQLPSTGFLGFLAWGSDAIWLDTASGPSLAGIVKVDLNTYKITKYDLTSLAIGTEYAFNPARTLLAFSDYPPMFDGEGKDQFLSSKKKINLAVYNLETKEQQNISSSTIKSFRPQWLDDKTLEYNDPSSGGRLKTTL
jgi:hypothetical protein